MNLLVIGNGLDLDLKLPTKYSDFLNFSRAFIFFLNQDIDKIYEFDIHNHSVVDSRYNKKSTSPNLIESYEKWKNILENFDESFSHKFINKACKDFFYCAYQNCWIEYFNERYEKNLIAGENWIDLEGEIQNVIHSIESRKNFEVISNANKNPSFNIKTFHLHIQNFMSENKTKNKMFADYYKQVKITLLEDFEKFVMALGIYLDFFVGQIKTNVANSSKELQKLLTSDSIGHVLSFNYINNFKTDTVSSNNVCFIHGAVHYLRDLQEHLTENLQPDDKNFLQIENIIRRNKMIVGFDSLQNSNELSVEDFELEFVDYKKYFQRIYKGTDSQYVDWLRIYQQAIQQKAFSQTSSQNTHLSFNEIYQDLLNNIGKNKPNKVFIFGHSLDATDNEILKDIFLREYDDTKITIFYHDLDARKRIITNLIKILGKPTLVEKTKGKNPTITFVAQSYADL